MIIVTAEKACVAALTRHTIAGLRSRRRVRATLVKPAIAGHLLMYPASRASIRVGLIFDADDD
jgi:hypothetical protein